MKTGEYNSIISNLVPPNPFQFLSNFLKLSIVELIYLDHFLNTHDRKIICAQPSLRTSRNSERIHNLFNILQIDQCVLISYFK